MDILSGGEIVLPQIAAQGGLDYQWSPATFLSATNVLNPTASPRETTTYILTVTDKVTGCTGTGTVTVTVNDIPVIPNTFTPNGDGINDFWIIEHLNTYTSCIINIYNRNGLEVYRSAGYSSPWDGTYKGSPLPSGTYYYVIDPKKGRKKIAGAITILK